MSQTRTTPFLELPDTLRRFSHEELLEGSESMSPARLLGKGGFGPVYLAQDRRSGRNLAIKVGTGVAEASVAGEAGVGQGRNEFENEALLLWLWQHERIVRLEGVSIGPTPCLVYEHMAGGSLASLICNPARAAAFSATQRLTVAADVAQALAYLHEGGCGANPPDNPRVRHAVVLHRDVNSHNVLLDGNLRGKLGDFGLCAMVHQADVHAGMVLSGNQLMGQWAWAAPEAQELGNSTASDVFALGLIILQLLSGCDDADLSVVRVSGQPGGPAVWDTRLPPALSWPTGVAQLALEIGLHCSEAAPSARPSANEALAALGGALSVLNVPYARAPPVPDTGGRTDRFEPCRIDQTGLVSTMLHFTPHLGPRAEAGNGDSSGRRASSSTGHHVRQPSLEAGVLRLYKWEGPGGRDASPGKKREAAVASVVAVVCCREEDAALMLDYVGWDVTHAVERFLAGQPVPAPRPQQRHSIAPAHSPRRQSMPPQAAGGGRMVGGGGRGGGAATHGGGGEGGGGGGGSSQGGDVGMVRLPPGSGTGSGRVQFVDSSVFTGSWVSGIVQGHGHFASAGKEYTGEFVDGRMHGQGVHRWKTADGVLEYDGAWEQGLMHGSGIVIKGVNRQQYQCCFERGRLMSQRTLFHKPALSQEERSYMVSIFQSVLQESTEEEAAACLSEYEWNLQSAIKAALQGNPSRSLFDGAPLAYSGAAAASVTLHANGHQDASVPAQGRGVVEYEEAGADQTSHTAEEGQQQQQAQQQHQQASAAAAAAATKRQEEEAAAARQREQLFLRRQQAAAEAAAAAALAQARAEARILKRHKSQQKPWLP